MNFGTPLVGLKKVCETFHKRLGTLCAGARHFGLRFSAMTAAT